MPQTPAGDVLRTVLEATLRRKLGRGVSAEQAGTLAAVEVLSQCAKLYEIVAAWGKEVCPELTEQIDNANAKAANPINLHLGTFDHGL